MKCIDISEKLIADHGVAASYPTDFFGYFGWPTVARMSDGTLVIAASGLRNAHVCPFGRTVFCVSNDDGESWASPAVINDFPIDDRDAGVCSPEPDTLVVSWFSSDTRIYQHVANYEEWEDRGRASLYRNGFKRITDDTIRTNGGFWIRVSRDRGVTWDQPVRVALTTPHGPIVLSDGRLLFFGKGDLTELVGHERLNLKIGAMASSDTGKTWDVLGTVPIASGTDENNYHEPHVVELAPGRLLGLIRVQDWGEKGQLAKIGQVPFSIGQTVSEDGGHTWSEVELLGFHGSPPHVFKHSSGTLVCVYGYREEPFGERVMLSDDNGVTWRYHYILRDDGPDSDLGYPSSVELGDGSILTVYYQKVDSPEEQCSLLWSRWRLP